MSKYIIEIDDDLSFDVQFLQAIGAEPNGVVRIRHIEFEKLEELNSDYINEHYGQLQDEAYKKGLHDGESKCGYCNEYQRGLDDAWEAARKIAQQWEEDTDTEHRLVIDDSISVTLNSMSANEAITKLKAYEEQNTADEIKVGDVVKIKYSDKHTFVVTKVSDESVWGVDADGSWNYWAINEVIKTGRHFDIESILEDMRG